MHIRTFRAACLQDALEQIRDQMGPDASVLHTRQVRDGWMGWLGRTYVEVTAGLKGAEAGNASLPSSGMLTSPGVDTHGGAGQGGSTGPSPGAYPEGSGVHYQSASVFDFSKVDTRSLTGSARERPLRIYESGQPDHRGIDPIHRDAVPLPLQSYFEELLSLGVAQETALRWIRGTVSFASSLGDSMNDSLSASIPWREHLQRCVGRELRIGSPIRTQPGDRRIVALVGPTGVGKTTTVAKLAAGFRLEARRRVGLLTIDTFRIAAVQQLRAYAEIMDLPMEVVEKPEQMRPALGRLGDVDLILIDTAGRSPRSDARIEQLVEMLRSAQPDETHLVLSSNSSVSSLDATIQGFAPVGPTSAILTKLDETPYTAAAVSVLVSAKQDGGIPLSYTTDGQQVPDDISAADASDVLKRLLRPQIAISDLDAA